METLNYMEYGAASFGFIGLVFGLSAQIVRNYHQGKSRVHWLFTGALAIAMLFRIGVFYLTGRYYLMCVDTFGVLAGMVVLMQGFGFF